MQGKEELKAYLRSKIIFRVVEEGENQGVTEGQLVKDYGLGLKMLFLVDLSKQPEYPVHSNVSAHGRG